MFMRGFPPAGGPGERKCECICFEKSNKQSDRDCHHQLSTGKNQPLDALAGKKRGALDSKDLGRALARMCRVVM